MTEQVHIHIVTDRPIEASNGSIGLKTQLGGCATSVANISRSSSLLRKDIG